MTIHLTKEESGVILRHVLAYESISGCWYLYEDEPDADMHYDSRKQLLKPGQKVAFNRSGDVIQGVILKAGRGPIQVECDPEFDHGYRSKTTKLGPNGHPISNIKNGTSVMILSESQPTAEQIYEYLQST